MQKTKEKKLAPTEARKEEKQEIQIIERIIENREVTAVDAFGKLTRPQIELIKRTVAQDASDDELKLFITICHGAQLNPFLRQAHLIPFWDSKTGTTRRVIVIGIDGFRSIAESSGAYAGNDDAIFEGEDELEYIGYDKKSHRVKHPVKATVSVYKVIGGQRYPFTASARWNEYYPGEKKGGQWHKMAFLMLGKSAEALALRKAFPKLLSGIYANEEMDQATQISETSPEIKQAKVFSALLKLIQKATGAEIGEWIEKIEKSDKYTPEQKAEFSRAVDARQAELETKK